MKEELSKPEWLQRIETEKNKKTGYLNLSSFGLEVIPAEINGMDWLYELNLSNNSISKIENLSGLPNLGLLMLYNNSIKKIENLDELPNLSGLYIDNNKIEKIENLEKLVNLEALALFRNEISEIQNLHFNINLGRLLLDFNKIKKIENLEQLTKLNFLTLPNNKIQRIENLSVLKNLTTLELHNNDVQEIENLEELTNLSVLLLNSNQIKEVKGLENLGNLKVINLSKNYIQKIKFPISKFNPLLTNIDLNENYLTDIGFVKGLQHLIELGLSNNTGITYVEALSEHTNLERLYLSQLKIKSFNFLEELTKLKRVVLSNTGLKTLKHLLPVIKNDIPVKLVYGYQDIGNGIFIKDNEELDISKEIIEQGNTAIIQFYELQQSKDHALEEIYLKEAKLILIGEGKVGKTSLRIKLADSAAPLPKDDERTRGIDIHDYSFVTKEKDFFKAHIWDFGGQNIQYALHRFFMTENSLYLLMTESRNERDKNFMYWFQNIDLFGGKDSPILIVMNLMHGERGANIDIASYVNEFKKIVNHEIIEVNLSNPDDNEGLLKLRNVIEYQLENLPHIRRPIFRCWLDGRKVLDEIAKTEPYITIERFQQICLANGVEEPFFELVGRYLHNLGIVLWYHDKEYLRNKMILNPNWAISAIYKIIDDKKIQDNKGRFNQADIDRLWNDPSYRFSKDELTTLLKVFKICFQRKGKAEYLVPALMEANTPAGAKSWDETGSITVIFQYTFMPKGIVNQLTADLHQHVKDELKDIWAYGVLLHYEDDAATTARIIEDTYKRSVKVQTAGNYASRFMGIIIQELKNINATYQGLKCEMEIPCNCEKCKSLTEPQIYTEKDLMEKLREGKYMVFCNKLDEKIDMQPILEGIGISHPALQKEKRHTIDIKNAAGIIPPNKKKKVFISYAHDDTPWLDNLNKHLAGLKNSGIIESWSDKAIKAGEKWDDVIKEQMANADAFICLLSASFIASDYIWNTELTTIFAKIRERNAKVIFVYMEPFYIGGLTGAKISKDESEASIMDFEIIPKDKNGKLLPAASWGNANEALAAITGKIHEALK